MLSGTGMILLLPLLGLVFTVLFAFLFDQSTITKQPPRMNALYRILFGMMWFIASTFIVIAVILVAIVNWFYQLIINKRDMGPTQNLVDWWIQWTKVIAYGYA